MLPEKATKKDLAQLFGLTVKRIEQLVQDGIITGDGGNPAKYPLVDTVRGYTKYLSGKAYGRDKKNANADLEKEKLAAEVRMKEAKAEMAELELKELDGELHRASDVEEILTDHVIMLRSALRALPGRLAVDLAGTHTAPEQADRVKKEIDHLLDILSDFTYDPDEYKRRVRQRQGWKEADEDE